MMPFKQRVSSQTYPNIVSSMNKNQARMNKIISSLNPQSVEEVAGAGNKFLHLATGKSDLYLNFVKGLKMWDTCAGDALIKSRFGVFTNAMSENIVYDDSQTDFTL